MAEPKPDKAEAKAAALAAAQPSPRDPVWVRCTRHRVFAPVKANDTATSPMLDGEKRIIDRGSAEFMAGRKQVVILPDPVT